MATGMARGARDRGKRIAFGDGRRIIWSQWSEPMFRNNPNIARPGDGNRTDLEWIEHHVGRRLYNSLDPTRTRWVWNMDFRAIAGEIFFGEDEKNFAAKFDPGFVVVEPTPARKVGAVNKNWPIDRYRAVVNNLKRAGLDVVQFNYPGSILLAGTKLIKTKSFRHALAVLARASLYIGPEGGLHHGAAAVGIPAVVLFGGFIPPQVTGYATHTNLTGGAVACGSLNPCRHCRAAMDSIGVGMVCDAALSRLSKMAAAVAAE